MIRHVKRAVEVAAENGKGGLNGGSSEWEMKSWCAAGGYCRGWRVDFCRRYFSTSESDLAAENFYLGFPVGEIWFLVGFAW
jgi:hypothetical protein